MCMATAHPTFMTSRHCTVEIDIARPEHAFRPLPWSVRCVSPTDVGMMVCPRYYEYTTFFTSTVHPHTVGDASIGSPQSFNSTGSGPDDPALNLYRSTTPNKPRHPPPNPKLIFPTGFEPVTGSIQSAPLRDPISYPPTPLPPPYPPATRPTPYHPTPSRPSYPPLRERDSY